MIREISPDFPHKPASESSLRSAAASKKQASAVKPSIPALSAASRSAASLAAAAGLPADKLSSSIVSFARFFSLPLKPQLLADIRRQAFAPQGAQPSQLSASQSAASQSAAANSANTNPSSALSGDSSAAAKIREALSLAAAAAESKGAELTPKGLESYAEAVDPDLQKRREGDRKRDGKEKNEHGEKEVLKTESITAGQLKKMALKYVEKDPLLEILNKLPGKNGQRWIVLPFDFVQGGREYRVSIRILLDDKSSSIVCMAMDIRERDEDLGIKNEEGAESKKSERRWLFVLESAGEKPSGLSVYLISNFSKDEIFINKIKLFKRRLSELFEIPLERITVKISDESFPYEAGFSELFSSVDEAV